MCEVLGSIPINVNERREMGTERRGGGKMEVERTGKTEINLGSQLILTSTPIAACRRLGNL